ncbi:uncharacterized protein BDW47DRAFT_106609 [Aspergillus candidus]|uniref:Tubby C-terminal-like domain-containing protein n=1 Tax=Aspergillus candidus TaxID=41067 RepID=A0A2I2FAM4_ASPCN|nr:hypothetical protein BDW47DRAFT_106609 [Aspergillus candidus]PLB37678.1 hypothetical protein BDW47DRAFT_106609 [Aspergillus candidus]
MNSSKHDPALPAYRKHHPTPSIDSTLENLPEGNSHLYHVYNTYWQNHYNVTTVDKRQLYHVDNSSWTPKKPDLTLHAGADNNAPTVAVCKFKHFSRRFHVGLGDPQNPNKMDWEEVATQSVMHERYRWHINLPSGRQAFVWKQTRSVGVDESFSGLCGTNFKLEDDRTGRLVGLFSSTVMSLKKSGKFRVTADYGNEFVVMALITALGLYESARRRQAAAGSGGGGGGGG